MCATGGRRSRPRCRTERTP